MLTSNEITAEAYRFDDEKHVHYVKITFQGMTIAGITVKASKYESAPLWVQMPAYKSGPNWKHYIEFRNSPLKDVIEEKCREAALDYKVQDSPTTAKPSPRLDVLEQLSAEEL